MLIMSEEMGNLVGDSPIITKIPGVERWYIQLLKNQTLYDFVIRLQNHVLPRLTTVFVSKYACCKPIVSLIVLPLYLFYKPKQFNYFIKVVTHLDAYSLTAMSIPGTKRAKPCSFWTLPTIRNPSKKRAVPVKADPKTYKT